MTLTADIRGKRFGRLRAVRRLGRRSGSSAWLCRCRCGTFTEVLLNNLSRGNTKSCGCLRREYGRDNAKDIAGRRFGNLIASRATGKRHGTNVIWICKCDCGNIARVPAHRLLSGHTKSCGCFRVATIVGLNKTHGMTESPEYMAFCSAKQRCRNPKDKGYKNYGGRGIRFLFKSFEQFYRKLGRKPSARHSLDRIENDGHYEPENVRWATKQQQIANRRPIRKVA